MEGCELIETVKGTHFSIDVVSTMLGGFKHYEMHIDGKRIWNTCSYCGCVDLIKSHARILANGKSLQSFDLNKEIESEDFVNKHIQYKSHSWLEEVRRLESILNKHGIKF